MSRVRIRQGLFFLIASLPIVIYLLSFLLTGNKLSVGDGDYITQTYEAARISILEYHQFPWWNPWVSGGVPLFANPQYGLFSLQSVITLIFGSIIGYKIAVLLYFLVGFFGFFLLFKQAFGTPRLTAVLLSYTWTFGSFLVHRVMAGHYTFLSIQFFPWLLYIFLRRDKMKRSWLWMGVTMALLVNSATHNISVMSLLVLALVAAFTLLDISLPRNGSLALRVNIKTREIGFWLKTLGVFTVLAGYKLFFSIQYIKAYPRLFEFPETSVGIPKAVYAIFGPLRQFENTPSHPVWSWAETSAYIGTPTALAALLTLIAFWKYRRTKTNDTSMNPWLIVILGIIFFLLGLGTIAGNLSPYSLFSQLPVFSDMRVSTRWLVWSSIFILLFIGLYKGRKFRAAINLLLIISVGQLFIVGRPYLDNPYVINPASYEEGSVINQQIKYDVERQGLPYDENLTAATRSNIGQIIAGDALVDTRWDPPYGINTTKCDSDDQTCGFIKTKNAEVVSWSPNRMVLKRTKPGNIILNMNPGSQWLVNDKYIFRDMRQAEPGKDFLITDESTDIEIKLMPRFSHNWLAWKFL